MAVRFDGVRQWSGKKKAGAGCCCAGLALFVMAGIGGALTGAGGDTAPSAAPSASAAASVPVTSAPAAATSTKAKPNATSAAPEATSTTSAPPAKSPEEEAQEWAEQVNKTALIGAKDWQDFCGGDYSFGSCYVTDVYATAKGDLYVKIQVDRTSPDAEQLAEDAGKTIWANAGNKHMDLDWVIVEDGTGVVITQIQRSDVPAINQH